MTLSKSAIYLLKERYCRDGEEPEGVFKRVAKYLSNGDEKLEDALYKAFISGTILPNSPCLFNAGLVDNPNLHACYILPIHDNLGAIFKTLTNMAYIFKTGGGVGINFGPLRERGAKLSKGGVSSGQLSFMSIFDNLVATVRQGGVRRGALMGITNYNHPEVFDFSRAKLTGHLQNFNLSIMVTDDFMIYCDTDKRIDLISPSSGEVAARAKAKDIFDIASFAAWCNGDPAFLFFDRINKDNKLYPEIVIDTTNPCAEVPMPHYSACCLGSVNMSKFAKKDGFDFEGFGEACILAMKMLTNMNLLGMYPTTDIQKQMMNLFPVGVGIMGFADCLIMLGIKYDSKECLDFIDQVGKVYKKSTEAYKTEGFGIEGSEQNYFYRRIIAPTGSLSIIANCSSGIEPIYDTAFQRRLEVGIIEETRSLYKSSATRTAHQVSPEWHVRVLSRWQKWVDGGVSKTVNLPYESSVDDVRTIYKMAWKMGCKGITVFRDNCRGDQVLVSKKLDSAPTPKCSDGSCNL